MFKVQPTAIVWDLDGTLVDSAPDLTTALNRTLDKRGFFTLPLEQVRQMIGNGVPKLVERGFNAVGIRPDAKQLELLVGIFVEEYRDCATEQTRPYPGIVEALEALKRSNMPMGVCTNKPEGFSRQILDGLGLSDYFACVIGGDTTHAKKPDPEPVRACLREMVSTPALSVMIGDSVHDIKAARAVGIPVGVVPWGYRSTPVEEMGADFVLDEPMKLARWVQSAGYVPEKTAH